jgi:hypothetical protein
MNKKTSTTSEMTVETQLKEEKKTFLDRLPIELSFLICIGGIYVSYMVIKLDSYFHLCFIYFDVLISKCEMWRMVFKFVLDLKI